jgi:hypothetical protein
MPNHEEGLGALLRRPTIFGATPQVRPRRSKVMRSFPSPRERTRSRNRDRYNQSPTLHLELDFRCECARPDCDVRLPLDTERHRHWCDRFIVGPGHVDGDTVVGLADHFVVVEAGGRTPSLYPLPAPATRSRTQVSAA